MKKAAGILLAGCMVVGLTACGGGKEETTTCTLEQNGVVIEMNLVAKGDKVTKLTQTSTINVEGYAEEQLPVDNEDVTELSLEATVSSLEESGWTVKE